MTLTHQLHPATRYALLAIPVTTLVIAPSMIDPINIPKLLALLIFAFTASVLYLALSKRTPKKVATKRSKLYITLYIFLTIAMLISGLLGSQNYIRIIFGTDGRNNGLLYYFSCITIALIVVGSVIGSQEIKYVYRLLIWTSIPFAIYCAAQLLDFDPVPWSLMYNRVIGTLGNPNFSASALAIFSVFWLYLSSGTFTRSPILRSSMFFTSLIMAFLSWSTESLQGLLVTALGFALIGYIQVRKMNANRFIPIIFFGSILLGTTFAFSSFLGLGPLGNQLEQYTLKLRGWYAVIGLRAMIESPWTGTGVDSYINAFRASRGSEFVSQYGAALSNNNAHSTPAQIGATFGVIVFTLYCVIHLLVLRRSLQVINSRSEELVELKGIAIVWILVFLQSLLSIEIIGLGVMNWVLGAILLSSQNSNLKPDVLVKKKRTENKALYPTWTGSLTLVAVLLASIPSFLIYREDQNLKVLSRVSIIDEASGKLFRENISKLSDYSLLTPEKVGLLIGNLYRLNMLPELKQVLTRLYSVSSNDAYTGFLMANYYRNTNQIIEEIRVREKLRNLDPWNYFSEFALAQAYERAGRESDLEESVAIIQQLAPESAEYEQAKNLLDNLASSKS